MVDENQDQFQIDNLPDINDLIWEESSLQENSPEYLALKHRWESKYGLVSDNLQPILDQYPFPKGIDRKQCEASTREFALSRTNLNKKKKLNKVEEYLVNLYPLPIGRNIHFYWEVDQENVAIQSLVEKNWACAGYAKRIQNRGTIGWFIGLVEEAAISNRTFEGRKLSIFEFNEFYSNNQPFKFIDSMILLDGKLDGCESVLSDMRNHKIDFDRNFLGNFTTGRRFSYDSEFYVSKAKEVLKKNPKLKQEILVSMIGRSLRAFQMDVRNENYKDFRHLKADVLKK